MNAHESDLLQRVDPIDRKLICERCQRVGQPHLEESGPHIKATCPNCGGYLKFVKQIGPFLDDCPECGGMNYIPGVPHCEPPQDKPHKTSERAISEDEEVPPWIF